VSISPASIVHLQYSKLTESYCTLSPQSHIYYYPEAVEKLRFFLATAPSSFPNELAALDPYQQQQQAYISSSPNQQQSQLDGIHRFRLPNGEHISCVRWQSLYHITGTDIIRTLVFRFHAFGRKICNMKKFEEGVFSDLRNLKAGTDATLETPKVSLESVFIIQFGAATSSDPIVLSTFTFCTNSIILSFFCSVQSALLDLLFKYNCIRTQKKQKVFYWYSVPHDKLFIDALERDAKREKAGLKATSIAVSAPASSFQYDTSRPLAEQLPAFNAVLSATSTSTSSSSSKTSAETVNPVIPFDEMAYTTVPEGIMSALARENGAGYTSGQKSFNLENYNQIADLGELQLVPPLQSTYEPVSSLHQRLFTSQESSDICMGLSSLGDTEPMHVVVPPAPADSRFICPILPCGLLFSSLNPLLQHLQQNHSAPSSLSETSPQLGQDPSDMNRGTQSPENAHTEYVQLFNVIAGLGSQSRDTCHDITFCSNALPSHSDCNASLSSITSFPQEHAPAVSEEAYLGTSSSQDTDPSLVTPTLYRRKTPFSFAASTSRQHQIAWPFDELHDPCAAEESL
jgi:hypothetical protein